MFQTNASSILSPTLNPPKEETDTVQKLLRCLF